MDRMRPWTKPYCIWTIGPGEVFPTGKVAARGNKVWMKKTTKSETQTARFSVTAGRRRRTVLQVDIPTSWSFLRTPTVRFKNKFCWKKNFCFCFFISIFPAFFFFRRGTISWIGRSSYSYLDRVTHKLSLLRGEAEKLKTSCGGPVRMSTKRKCGSKYGQREERFLVYSVFYRCSRRTPQNFETKWIKER